ncbi:MAG: Sensor histidine kinase YpdA [Betaproteobacteria bacterium ADurb.Bin341]|nr:MAG: Sensor histidine kinase YpdA [Betaproteobacteria bacterium ADurb.Bin341]
MAYLTYFAVTLLINTLIAVFLTAIGFGMGFAINLLFSNCIGFSICLFTAVAVRLTQPGLIRLLAVTLAIPTSSALGYVLARFIGNFSLPPSQSEAGMAILIGLVFGGIVSAFFYLRERNNKLQAEVQARELQRLEAEKGRIEAQLKMLQAQIEPHFLFNTLSNVSALIGADPGLAAKLLESLIVYLRASLARTRAGQGSLGDEVALLQAYLAILKIRLGARLDYAFDFAPELRSLPFPPMLLQPLVENAVVHGIEPKPEGGMIRVSAALSGGRLVLAVRDNGAGLKGNSGQGLGLVNVRARLESLYAGAARLQLSENAEGGMTALLEVPA